MFGVIRIFYLAGLLSEMNMALIQQLPLARLVVCFLCQKGLTVITRTPMLLGHQYHTTEAARRNLPKTRDDRYQPNHR